MASVIIPAHNEESVIARCLESLLPQLSTSDELIVVCNGCTDRTREVAEQYAPRVVVLETMIRSKTHALNMGDELATSFPRFYVDADVSLQPGGLDALKVSFQTSGRLALAPSVEMAKSPSRLVNAYYDIWLLLPYCKRGLIGAGMYAVSEAGRARFDTFPALISDDGFFRAQFSEDERGSIPNAVAVVQAPRRLKSLIKIKTRSRLGVYELRNQFPSLLKNERKDYGSALIDMLQQPSKWVSLAVYMSVNLWTRLEAKRQVDGLADYVWEIDQSTRAL